jgi:pimeloyl-ACP methyl ester carboxylesterase
MAWADLPAGRFYYEDAGEGETIVFSHGFLMDHEMFIPQIDALRGSYRCVSWDQRGHGATEASGDWSFWDSADDLLGLLDHLRVESAFLVGMSQGGFISLRTALAGPPRVRGLVLIDTQAGLESPDLVPAYDAMVAQWTTEGPTQELGQATASIILGPGTDQEPWIEKWMARDPDDLGPIYRTLMSRDDITDRLGDISAPALVLHGEDDVAIAVDRARTLCEGLGGCDGLLLIPGAGHASNLGDPDTVNEAIDSFLKKHS